jgi:aspartyl-tRNA(Asn)/glutamyl-tRNA(Gln) amidotransferase subunit B
MSLIQGQNGVWEMVLGLEVHAQVTSNSKLFSGASTDFGGAPNSQVSFIDAGFPGMLPVINGFCVEQAIRTGLGLNAKVNSYSIFDRKNYFYADLPTGYQISQYQAPIVSNGYIDIELADGSQKRIGIERLHLEQDAGKSLHDQSPNKSFVDLNRAGIALMEIVSRPDLRSGEEVGAYVKKLRSILRYLGTCDGNMEEGSLRVDVNLSLHRPGTPFGTRCEIKNVNSIRHILAAIDYEAARQLEILEAGGAVRQETRLYDAGRNETRSMRNKEEAHDYRYFPCPDLLPLVIAPARIEEAKAKLPELPDAKKARLMADYKLSAYDADILVQEKARAYYYEAAVRGAQGALAALPSPAESQAPPLKVDGKLIANWVISELLGVLNKNGQDIEAASITAEQLGELVALIQAGTISGRIAKDVFALMLTTGESALAIVQSKGLRQVSDSGAIEGLIEKVLEEHADKVAEYRAGKDKLFGFFVGQVMKQSQGKANPALLNNLLEQKLKG